MIAQVLRIPCCVEKQKFLISLLGAKWFFGKLWYMRQTSKDRRCTHKVRKVQLTPWQIQMDGTLESNGLPFRGVLENLPTDLLIGWTASWSDVYDCRDQLDIWSLNYRHHLMVGTLVISCHFFKHCSVRCITMMHILQPLVRKIWRPFPRPWIVVLQNHQHGSLYIPNGQRCVLVAQGNNVLVAATNADSDDAGTSLRLEWNFGHALVCIFLLHQMF